jgi:hypothetical protein
VDQKKYFNFTWFKACPIFHDRENFFWVLEDMLVNFVYLAVWLMELRAATCQMAGNWESPDASALLSC